MTVNDVVLLGLSDVSWHVVSALTWWAIVPRSSPMSMSRTLEILWTTRKWERCLRLVALSPAARYAMHTLQECYPNHSTKGKHQKNDIWNCMPCQLIIYCSVYCSNLRQVTVSHTFNFENEKTLNTLLSLVKYKIHLCCFLFLVIIAFCIGLFRGDFKIVLCGL